MSGRPILAPRDCRSWCGSPAAPSSASMPAKRLTTARALPPTASSWSPSTIASVSTASWRSRVRRPIAAFSTRSPLWNGCATTSPPLAAMRAMSHCSANRPGRRALPCCLPPRKLRGCSNARSCKVRRCKRWTLTTPHALRMSSPRNWVSSRRSPGSAASPSKISARPFRTFRRSLRTGTNGADCRSAGPPSCR